jgi:hypothetical protein
MALNLIDAQTTFVNAAGAVALTRRTPDVAAVVDRGRRVSVVIRQAFDHGATAVSDRGYIAHQTASNSWSVC